MKFDNNAASIAAHGLVLVLSLVALVALYGCILYLVPWPMKAFFILIVAVPVVAGFWPAKKKGPG